MTEQKVKQFELLIFDWDGTLADSTRPIVDAVYHASDAVGIPRPEEQAACDIIGLELREALRVLFADVDDRTLAALVTNYQRYFSSVQNDIPLFDGVVDALQTLSDQGFMLAVASGKGRNGLHHAIQRSGLEHLILAKRSADDCFSKPHPQMLFEITDELGVDKSHSIMIGDTTFDMQMAQNADIASLAVSYGAQVAEKLYPYAPLACFDSFAKLYTWLSTNA
ncbi:MAG TPA: HAD-IA family hydrolase [Methylophilaceae bacterium]|jgi:phosphoglycolate phosphatase